MSHWIKAPALDAAGKPVTKPEPSAPLDVGARDLEDERIVDTLKARAEAGKAEHRWRDRDPEPDSPPTDVDPKDVGTKGATNGRVTGEAVIGAGREAEVSRLGRGGVAHAGGAGGHHGGESEQVRGRGVGAAELGDVDRRLDEVRARAERPSIGQQYRLANEDIPWLLSLADELRRR